MDTGTSKVLRALEESLWQSETRFDEMLMERVFAPDFIEFGRSGRIYLRAELIVGPADQEPINAVLPLPNFSARYLTKDIAQVTYISEIHRAGIVERANRSSIWGSRGEEWRLHFHQGTAID